MWPIIIHVAVVLIITAFFVISYIRQRYLYQLLFAIWAPTTLLRYLSNNRIYLIVLGIVQVFMFILVIVSLFRSRNELDGKDESDQPAADSAPLPEDSSEEAALEDETSDTGEIRWNQEQE